MLNGKRLLDGIWGMVLVGLALFFADDYVEWVKADKVPPLNEDSPFHAARILSAWWRWVESPGFSTLFPPGNYPPAANWPVFALFAIDEPSLLNIRLVGAFFTFLLVIGSGILAAQVWGKAAGLAAACLAITFPVIWTQRSTIMLSLSAAAFGAIGMAFLPASNKNPSAFRAILAGVGLGLALLAHLEMLYWIAALGVFQGLGALNLLRRREERARSLKYIRDVALTFTVCGALAALWYIPSLPIIVDVLRDHADKYGTQGLPLSARLFFPAYLKHEFMFAPHAWAFLVGLMCLPFLVKRTPLAAVLVAAGLGGLFGLQRFPQIHERYFLPLIPQLLIVILAPFGLLRLWNGHRTLRSAVSLLLAFPFMYYGLRFSSGWHFENPMGSSRMSLRHDGVFKDYTPQSDPSLLWFKVRSKPRRWVYAAPFPHRGLRPLGEAVERIEAAFDWPPVQSMERWLRPEEELPRQRPIVFVVESDFEPGLVRLEALARGEPRWRLVSVSPRAFEDGSISTRLRACAEVPCALLVQRFPWALSPLLHFIEGADFEVIARLRARSPDHNADQTLIVARFVRSDENKENKDQEENGEMDDEIKDGTPDGNMEKEDRRGT